MILSAVICPPIQSIVVVTSPSGDQAPPALAAITVMPIKNNRCSLSIINFLSNETITIVVVRLSKMAERKKVIKEIEDTSEIYLCIYTMYNHMFSNAFLFRVRHHQDYLVFVHVDILVLDGHKSDDYV